MGVPALLASKYPPIDRKQRNLRTRASLEILPRASCNLCARERDPEADGKSGTGRAPLRRTKRLINDVGISGNRHGTVENVRPSDAGRVLDEEESTV